MESLLPYDLPLGGLKDGIHRFQYQVDDTFFAAFEASPYRDGNLEVELVLDKRPGLLDLKFSFHGTLRAECDRCSDLFDLPLESEDVLLVKYSEEEREEEDVIYIPQGTQSLNVAQYIYEFILLAVPMVKTHDLADEGCDPEVTKYLADEGTSETDDTPADNPIWDALKDLKDN